MNQEIVSASQKSEPTGVHSSAASVRLSEEQIHKLTKARAEALASIQSKISRKLYYIIEEKLAAEEKQLRDILDWQQGKLNRLSKYTFILDPHYFEQEFISS